MTEDLMKSKCVRCGASVSGGGPGARCKACLKKLKTARHTPGTYQRNHQQADSALRRQDGKNGTASHKSSGRGSRKEIVDKMKRAEKKTHSKLSADRKDNSKGYASSNVRAVPEKLNRGRHTVDNKKLTSWRKRLSKCNVNFEDFILLVKHKLYVKHEKLQK